MIQVQIGRNIEGVLLSFKAEGHAGYAKKGSDIVCSAVSVLVKTSLQILEELEKSGYIDLRTDSSRRGFACFVIGLKVDVTAETKTKLCFLGDFLECGIKNISSEYPDFVKLQVNVE